MTLEPAPVGPANPVAVPTRRSNRLLDIALAVAAVLAIGAVAFAAGRITAPAASPAFARGGLIPGGAIVGPDGSFDPGTGPNGARPGFALDGGLAIDGTVTAVDADSITLKLADGQEMTFKLDDTTTYHEAADASASDVAVGDDVSVKVTGGRVAAGGGAETPQMSAADVTVGR
jgi:ABC-type transport system substrate-binding protein